MLEFLRHDLVWLDKKSQANFTPSWGYNCVVTKQSSLIQDGMLRVAYQVSSEKSTLSRKSCVVPQISIIRHNRPLLFNDALAHFGLVSIAVVLDKLEALGVVVRIYGSFSWQYLTGMPYITTTSDIDLLFYLPDDLNSIFTLDVRRQRGVVPRYLAHVYELLLQLEFLSPRKIDGELVFPNGYFVAWRELFNHEAEVLVKTTTAGIMRCNKDEVWQWS